MATPANTGPADQTPKRVTHYLASGVLKTGCLRPPGPGVAQYRPTTTATVGSVTCRRCARTSVVRRL